MRKYWTIFKTEMASMAAFRAEGFIWLLFDLFLFIVYPFVLLTVLREKGALGMLDAKSVITYYVAVAFFSNFLWTHPETHVGLEIKDGKLTNFLVKPHNYLVSTLLHEIAWKLMRFLLFAPLLILFFAVAWRYLAIPPLAQVPLALLAWPGALLIFYLTAFLVGATALWLEENSALLSLFWISSGFFGGFYLPLNLLPEWLARVSEILPWRYAIYEPIQAMVAPYDIARIGTVILIQLMWVIGLYTLYRLVWFFGMRKYTAVGR